jgi:hypothetical protein
MLIIAGRRPAPAPCPGMSRVRGAAVATARQDAIIDDIIELSPSRVIFNPGTENPGAHDRLEAKGIEVVEACTLVLLRRDQF